MVRLNRKIVIARSWKSFERRCLFRTVYNLLHVYVPNISAASNVLLLPDRIEAQLTTLFTSFESLSHSVIRMKRRFLYLRIYTCHTPSQSTFPLAERLSWRENKRMPLLDSPIRSTHHNSNVAQMRQTLPCFWCFEDTSMAGKMKSWIQGKIYSDPQGTTACTEYFLLLMTWQNSK